MSPSCAARTTPASGAGYLFAVVVVAAFTAVGLGIRDFLMPRDLVLVLLLGVVLVAHRGTQGPSLLAVALGVGAYDFFFVPPYYTLKVAESELFISFIAFAAVGVTISGLTARVRENAREAHQARLLAETERVRSALLSSVSHDLRTPLGAIIGSASTLRDEPLDGEGRAEMVATICEEAGYLRRLLDNLLQMTRVEGGGVQVHADWQQPEEIAGAALRRLDGAVASRPVAVEIDPAVGLVRFDGLLIELALVNLLDNALKYSPAGTAIEISVVRRASEVIWLVADRGVGVPESEALRVFEKFYRIPGRHQRGSGLGLTIARAVLEAHGGRIWVEARADGLPGAVFGFALPWLEAPPLPDERPG